MTLGQTVKQPSSAATAVRLYDNRCHPRVGPLAAHTEHKHIAAYRMRISPSAPWDTPSMSSSADASCPSRRIPTKAHAPKRSALRRAGTGTGHARPNARPQTGTVLAQPTFKTRAQHRGVRMVLRRIIKGRTAQHSLGRRGDRTRDAQEGSIATCRFMYASTDTSRPRYSMPHLSLTWTGLPARSCRYGFGFTGSDWPSPRA
jgi:hypothetical protein